MTDNTSFALRVLNDRCTGCGLCADTVLTMPSVLLIIPK